MILSELRQLGFRCSALPLLGAFLLNAQQTADF